MISLTQAGSRTCAARRKPGHVRLDVEHRRAVDGVEAAHAHGQAVHGDDVAGGHADAVRPALAALGEDADLRPVGAAARMPRAALDFLVRHEMELIDHRQVAEVAEACGGFRGELRRVQHDVGFDLAPVVVDRLFPAAAHETDRPDLAHAGSFVLRPLAEPERVLDDAQADLAAERHQRLRGETARRRSAATRAPAPSPRRPRSSPSRAAPSASNPSPRAANGSGR